ncbi:hypothetical protein AXX17_AT5G10400 [Arabidopsis thaliana]|uniref:Uncharacterized protein n=1 Tax=Arabidopsis thaliana TaxID=3702 RepID=A0A178UMC8_ARATH|nr:hypothetical protein AXX17_AT5G10400 [Arabidopsis thaliana]
MSSPWVTGFTDWPLIVELRVREANSTEETFESVRDLNYGGPEISTVGGFCFRSDICD